MPLVVSRQVQAFPVTLRHSLLVMLALLLLTLSQGLMAQQSCPDLQAYYPDNTPDWPRLVEQLIVLQPRCLESAEYYALLGAAELNSGYLDAALEALERALLMQPDHGGAAVDYAQALYISGQEFSALELNAQLLRRSDLPPDLGALLRQRQEIWQAQTRTHRFVAEAALGYDNNLNGAPSRSDFTLTVPGDVIQLPLDEAFRPVSGSYANLRIGGYYQRRGAARTHDLAYGVRTRQSESADTELLQADWRYALGIPLRHYRWELATSSTHLLYGGSPLFTATDLRARLLKLNDVCQPLAEVATQHQAYHKQSIMAGVELGLTGGVECRVDERRAVFGIEAGLVRNQALKSARPGGDRDGWILRLAWQQVIGRGFLNSQFSLATLEDARGYSALLANGARREIYSRQLRVQYLRPLQQNLTLQFNLSHQRQGSNLAPFENRGTAADIGLSLAF
jgi:tetratricopeptide (TPR) repeat protein